VGTNTIRLHRVFRASPEKIYRAFLDADAMVKWLPPNGFTGKVHHIDPKVGGTFKMSFINFTTGKSHSFGGQYLELVPHERIRYTDNFDDPNLPGEIRCEHSARRCARRDSCRGMLPRLARIADPSRETCGSGDPRLTA
jgi:uncharacterized protein YndB with AHSA1/START domain